MTATVTRIPGATPEQWDIDIPLDIPPTPRARRRQRVQAAGDAVYAVLLFAAGATITRALTGRR